MAPTEKRKLIRIFFDRLICILHRIMIGVDRIMKSKTTWITLRGITTALVLRQWRGFCDFPKRERRMSSIGGLQLKISRKMPVMT